LKINRINITNVQQSAVSNQPSAVSIQLSEVSLEQSADI